MMCWDLGFWVGLVARGGVGVCCYCACDSAGKWLLVRVKPSFKKTDSLRIICRRGIIIGLTCAAYGCFS